MRRASSPSVFFLSLAAVALTTSGEADVVINEIMFHPGHTLPVPENIALEWVELHNTDLANPVDLSGWAFDEGVNLTFPDTTQIAPGGFLIVAADRDALLAAQPDITAPIIGGWTGRLGNGGEELRLIDATGTEIDTVPYADEGEWALKVREPGAPGWLWQNAAAGGGSSLERRKATAPGAYGQNWSPSLIVAGTPGMPNSIATTDLPPLILDVRHSPAVPRGGEAVTLTARVIDDSDTPPVVFARLEIAALQGSTRVETLIAENTQKRSLVPTNGALGDTWREPEFNDSTWQQHTGGVGYDLNPTYLPHIGYDTLATMFNNTTSAYSRTEFEITDLADANGLILRIRIDDGFAAFINGFPVTTFNTPATLSWNSIATVFNLDSSAIQLRPFDISENLDRLHVGTNVLAIHSLNNLPDSSDFLSSWTLEIGFTEPPIPMFDDGLHGDGDPDDGVYGAIVDGQPDGQIMSFRISASDTVNERLWPAHGGALYQHDDEQPGAQPLYRVVMSPIDYSIHLGLNRGSNTLFDATFIAGDTVRYAAGVRFRGNSSRSANPPPIRIDLPGDRPWRGSTKLNINSLWPHQQVLGMRLFAQAGLPTPEATAVAVRFNSNDRQAATSPSFGLYAHIEPLGDEFVDNHLPREQRGGDMYKKQGSHNSDWQVVGNYAANGWEKRNNRSAADSSDLHAFHLGVNTPADGGAYTDTLENLIDIEQWLRWLALNNLINNRETNLSNGNDDDYTIYQRSDDGRWIVLPHDLDSILGRGQSGSSTPTETIYQMLTSFGSRRMEIMRPLVQNGEFGPRYLAQIEDLLETVLAPDRFSATVDSVMHVATQTERDFAKTFMRDRREHLLGRLRDDLTITWTIEGNNLTLSGTAPLAAATITVNGELVTIDRDNGIWSLNIPFPEPITLVERTAVWQYLDDGSDPGASWQFPNFDDSAWATGAAPLGYGDINGNVTTEIESGGLFGFGQNTTAFFRHTFTAPAFTVGLDATLSLLYDDGVAVYLNGVEITRQNLPDPAPPGATALSEVPDDPPPADITIPIDSALITPDAINVIAAEVHISDPDFSPDTLFALGFEIEADFSATLALIPGINHFTARATDATGELIVESSLAIRFDTGAVTPLSGQLDSDTLLDTISSPYQISGDLIVPAGTTLTIAPGTTLYFTKDAGLIVLGTLIAAGEPDAPIYFIASPDAPDEPDIHPLLPLGPPKWDGIHFEDSNSSLNVVAHAVIAHAQDSGGAIGAVRSTVRVSFCTFSGTHRRMIYTDDSSMLIEDCTFPDMFAADESPAALGLDNTSEHIKGIRGIPDGGHYIIRGNTFGTNKGHNDVVDVDSNQRPDPILQIFDNTFEGSGDELLDLGGDVLVAGNLFQNVAKDPDNADRGYANAISSGDAAPGSTVVVTRNLFLNIDHAINLKRGDATIFENNTVVGVHPDFIDTGGNPVVTAAINLYVAEPGATPGSGAYAADNIFVDAPRAFGNADLPGATISALEFHRNLVAAELAAAEVGARGAGAIALGDGNITGPPGFADPDAGDFRIHPRSPATGAGAAGQDLGAMVEDRIYITGEPAAITPRTSATLTFGGPGMFAFRYRINDGAWGDAIPIGSGFDPAGTVRSAALELADLAPGSYTVEAIGRDFAGNWGAEVEPTISRTWTVDPAAPPVRISEVFAAGNPANPDFVELQNLTDTEIDLAGWTLADAETSFVLPLGTTIAADARLVVFADNATPGPGLHAPFRIGLDGDTISWSDPDGNLIDSLALGGGLPGTSIARGRDAWLLASPTPGIADVFLPTAAPTALLINEWLTDDDVVVDDEFIELYNTASLPVALGGLALTDAIDLASPHSLPPLAFISAGGHIVLTTVGGAPEDLTLFQLPFKISSTGNEILVLLDVDGQIIDVVAATPLATDFAGGRDSDGAGIISSFRLPTPGTANPGNLSSIVLPEEELIVDDAIWNYHTEFGAPPADWRDHDFDDSSWASGPAELGFGDSGDRRATTQLTRGAIAYYFRTGFTIPDDGDGISSYRVEMVRDDGAVLYIDGVEVLRNNMPAGVQIGDLTRASSVVGGQSESFFFPNDLPGISELAPGTHTLAASVHQWASNSSDLSFALRLFRARQQTVTRDPEIIRAEQIFDNLRITELMYHPAINPTAEFVELYNTSATDSLDLEGLRLADAIDFTFPALTLPPGGYLLVVANIVTFEATYGAGLPVVGQYTSRLANSDERVRLILPAPLVAQVLNFRYEDLWYPSTDGDGPSLEIVDPTAGRARWTLAAGWRPSDFSGGTPGGVAPLDFDTWAAVNGITDPDADPDGNVLSAFAEYALGIAPGTPAPISVAEGAFTLDLPSEPRPDVRYLAQTSTDLGTWQTVAQRDGTAAWSGDAPPALSSSPAGHGRATFPTDGDELFFRLVLERIAP